MGVDWAGDPWIARIAQNNNWGACAWTGDRRYCTSAVDQHSLPIALNSVSWAALVVWW
jgi:hypothetical protein